MLTTERKALLMEVAATIGDLQRPFDEGLVLADLGRTAAKLVPGAQFAGITIVRSKAGLETVGATHDSVALLDDLQRRHNEGPCLAAARDDEVIRIDDLAHDDRWPRYRDDAVSRTTIRSVLSLPLFAETKSAGALNFYAEPTRAFDDESLEVGLVFATHIALVRSMPHRDEQFRSALAVRDIIGQAKGIVMERFGLDAGQAFELPKRLSQTSSTRLAVVAGQLAGDHPLR